MSLLNSASLCVTPNAYKEGTLYSVIPNTTLGDMTVVRATTATRVNSAGLIESVANNVPRLDYSNGSCPSLLVEPQRTNLLTYSEQFDNAGWTKTRLTISANTSVSPDGFTSADSVFETTDNNTHLLFRRPNVTATNPFTFSCFVKANGRRRLNLQIFDSSTLFASALFDVISGVVIATNGTSKIEDYGNGWYRCAISNVSPTTSLGYAQIGLATDTYTNANVLDSYVGDVTKGVLLYGAQFELGSYATSYIPTTTAAVTRNADVISKTGISSLIGQTEGVIFADFVWEGSTTGAADYPLLVYGSSYGNFVALSTFNNTNAMYVYVGGANVVAINGTTFVNGQRYKIAMAYKLNDFVYYLNGTQMGTDTSAGVPSSMANLRTDTPYGGKSTSQKYNSVIFFPTRLTNAELAQLTTL